MRKYVCGAQIVPASWAARFVLPAAATRAVYVHQHLWRQLSDNEGDFYAYGHGQYLYVNPKARVVIVKFSETHRQDPVPMFRAICGALRGPESIAEFERLGAQRVAAPLCCGNREERDMKRINEAALWFFLLFGLTFASARADVVTDWNVATINATLGGSTLSQTRVLAMVHVAIFDAVNGINRRHTPYAIDIKAPPDASMEAAAAAAAHGVLSKLVPAQKATFDNLLEASLSKIPEGKAKTDGINVGREAAERRVHLRKADGADAKVEYKPGSGPGAWQPTPPAFQPAAAPQWGAVTPFILKHALQFSPPGMPAVTTAEYARDVNEVKEIGGANSTVRSADQTAAAIFWTTQTTVPWNAAARAASEAQGLSVAENARLFALLSMATADAYITAWAVKYRDNVLRPVTAIRNAQKLGNPAIRPDPAWESLIATPAHPDYVSGHCIYSGTAEKVLQSFFGNDQVKVSVTYPPVFGVTRHYTSFSRMAKEVENARVWGGIHTRTADVHATELGRRIGEHAINNYLQPLSPSASK